MVSHSPSTGKNEMSFFLRRSILCFFRINSEEASDSRCEVSLRIHFLLFRASLSQFHPHHCKSQVMKATRMMFSLVIMEGEEDRELGGEKEGEKSQVSCTQIVSLPQLDSTTFSSTTLFHNFLFHNSLPQLSLWLFIHFRWGWNNTRSYTKIIKLLSPYSFLVFFLFWSNSSSHYLAGIERTGFFYRVSCMSFVLWGPSSCCCVSSL